jgi:nicotinamide-nucleotide amidase
VNAEIIPIGTEILLGNITDTNSSFLANQLPSLGINLHFISTVGDNRERIVDTLKQAWTRAELIITTGGLGPTLGDITRESIAELLGEEPTVDLKLWQTLQDMLGHYHREIPQANMKQATIIPSAQIIPNPVGTAPGWWIEKDNHIVVAMPGPPHEMQLMWKERVLPKLRQKITGTVILSKTIKTFGKAEAKIDELLSPFLQLPNPTLASYAKPDGIYLRITAKGEEETAARHMIAEREADIRQILAPYIWGVDNDTLEATVGELLKTKNLSLATMESCTEGLLSSTIASYPQSLAYFKGGLIACCDEAKVALGIDTHIMERYGKESSQVAEAMAEVAQKTLKADIGIGIAGIMNIGEKTANIFIAMISGNFKQTITRTFLGDKWRMKQRTVYAALFELGKNVA